MYKLAVFDFDGTIYPFDTFTYLVKQLKEQGYKKYYYKFFISFLPMYTMYKAKLMNKSVMRTKAMETLVRSLQGLSQQELEQFCHNAFRGMASKANKEITKEMAEKQNQGYQVIILSGAIEPFLKIAGDYLGSHTVIGTSIPMLEGVVKLTKAVEQLQGQRKLTKLWEVYPKDKVDWQSSYAYADSISDLDILEQVGNPVAVAPDSQLLEIAKERHWTILNMGD